MGSYSNILQRYMHEPPHTLTLSEGIWIRHLQQKSNPPPPENKVMFYETKLHLMVSYGDLGVGITPSLLLFSGSFWPEVIEPFRTLHMAQKDHRSIWAIWSDITMGIKPLKQLHK